ncbi:MAG: hypothetical protein JW720_08820 [Sedimentisphaerales bacterium]|nr:hypothetical protein [Sedimentisphaerales bacterium]
MNYLFNTEHISQHFVKYVVHVHPPLGPGEEKAKLQDYCNALIDQSPQAFETLLSGPNQLRVQKAFILPGGKRVDMPTFILTPQGPLLTFPEKLYIDQPIDVDLPDKDRIFRKALDELTTRFSDRAVRRVGVIHDFVFDTGRFNSLEIISSNLKPEIWRERLSNLNIHLEMPTEDKNVNIDIRPTHVMHRRRQGPQATPEQFDSGAQGQFGVMVVLDINNRKISGDLTKPEVNDILAFAADYVTESLIPLLNNEY